MSTYKRAALGRRTFLRGAGVTLALPFLEAMISRNAYAAGASEVPRRLGVYYVPNGIHMQSWTPEATGTSWVAKEILTPIEQLREHMLIISGLENDSGWGRADGAGDHARGTGTFLTARRVRKTNGSDIQNGISFDQVAASELKQHTRLPSLQFGLDQGKTTGNCDSGYSCAYAHNISWANDTTPLPKIASPQQAFDYTFGGFDPTQSAEAVATRRALRKSVLDYVKDDTSRLKSQLGQRDQTKLEQYMEGVRELEVLVEKEGQGPSCSTPEEPGSTSTHGQRARLFADLMAANFECDMTRVITFMLANAGSGRNYQSEPGVMVSGGHHQISHHESKQQNYDKLIAIGRWEVELFAYFVNALKEKTDVDGNSVLHNSVLFFSSEISDGNRHNHDNLPVLLAGHGGGLIKTGEHVRVTNKTPIANLFLTLLQNVGVQTDSFGADSTGPLSEILV